MLFLQKILSNSWFIALSYVFSAIIYWAYNPLMVSTKEYIYLLLPVLCSFYLQLVARKSNESWNSTPQKGSNSKQEWTLGFIVGFSFYIGQGHLFLLILALIAQFSIEYILTYNPNKTETVNEGVV